MTFLHRNRGLVALLLILLLPTAVVVAQTATTVVEAGETINNDVTVFDEDLEIQDGARVKGDVTVFGGTVTLAGEVDGNLVLFDGDLILAETAYVTGNCVILDGELTGQAAQPLDCSGIVVPESLDNAIGKFPFAIGDQFTTEPASEIAAVETSPTFFAEFGVGLIRSLLLGALAFAVASYAPGRLQRMQQAIKERPIASGTVGSLTGIAISCLAAIVGVVTLLLVFVCIGILFIPVAIGIPLLLAAGIIFGWISIGTLVGERLVTSLKIDALSVPQTAALGTAAVTLVLHIIGALPFLFGAGFVTVALCAIGLGAATLTQLGIKAYPQRPLPQVAPDEDKVQTVLETVPAEEMQLKE